MKYRLNMWNLPVEFEYIYVKFGKLLKKSLYIGTFFHVNIVNKFCILFHNNLTNHYFLQFTILVIYYLYVEKNFFFHFN